MWKKETLDELVLRFEQPDFIARDPIAIPHAFDDPEDQEIVGLFAALLAWGRRETTLAKMQDLCERMDYRPRRFVLDFSERSTPRLAGFKHRTFQPEDALHLLAALKGVLRRRGRLSDLFGHYLKPGAEHIGEAIEGAVTELLDQAGMPLRMRKHLARPSTGSACKRICLYLRWMVRPGPVDLGLWDSIRLDQLVLPLDVHSAATARRSGMLTRRQNDWKSALELTRACRTLDPNDPCRYDYAFFGMGIEGGGPAEGGVSSFPTGEPSRT